MVPDLAFTPNVQRTAYQIDYNDQDPRDDLDDHEQNFMSILKVDLEDAESLSNLEENLNSPRTIEAMKSLGLSFRDLMPINRKDIYDYYVNREKKKDIPNALIELRYNTLNKRRYTKKEMIIQERKNIIRIE